MPRAVSSSKDRKDSAQSRKRTKTASKPSRTSRTADRARRERDEAKSQPQVEVDLITPLRELDTLNLALNDEIDARARYCSPSDYPPEITLSRVHITPNIKLTEPGETAKPSTDAGTKSDDASPASDGPLTVSPTIVLQRWRGYSKPNEPEARRFGLTADIFYADLRVAGKSSPGLVVKLVDLRCVRERGRLPTQSKVKEDLASEVHNFNVAESLQGSCLPRLAGLFRWESLYCLVFDYAGKPLKQRERGTRKLQKEVISALKRIHAVGLGPYYDSDSSYRVVRRGPDGGIRFSQLYNSERVDLLPPARLQEFIDERHPYAGLTAEETLVKLQHNGITVLKEDSFPCVYDDDDDDDDNGDDE